jgi:DNA mismatch repair protein MutS
MLNLKKKKKDEMQMSFNLDDPLLEDIKEEILSLDNTVTLWRR